jgi:hypothetical protein
MTILYSCWGKARNVIPENDAKDYERRIKAAPMFIFLLSILHWHRCRRSSPRMCRSF